MNETPPARDPAAMPSADIAVLESWRLAWTAEPGFMVSMDIKLQALKSLKVGSGASATEALTEGHHRGRTEP